MNTASSFKINSFTLRQLESVTETEPTHNRGTSALMVPVVRTMDRSGEDLTPAEAPDPTCVQREPHLFPGKPLSTAALTLLPECAFKNLVRALGGIGSFLRKIV